MKTNLLTMWTVSVSLNLGKKRTEARIFAKTSDGRTVRPLVAYKEVNAHYPQWITPCGAYPPGIVAITQAMLIAERPGKYQSPVQCADDSEG